MKTIRKFWQTSLCILAAACGSSADPNSSSHDPGASPAVSNADLCESAMVCDGTIADGEDKTAIGNQEGLDATASEKSHITIISPPHGPLTCDAELSDSADSAALVVRLNTDRSVTIQWDELRNLSRLRVLPEQLDGPETIVFTVQDPQAVASLKLHVEVGSYRSSCHIAYVPAG